MPMSYNFFGVIYIPSGRTLVETYSGINNGEKSFMKLAIDVHVIKLFTSAIYRCLK